MKLSLDTIGYTSKPSKKDRKEIEERINISIHIEGIEELAEIISEGRSFKTAEFTYDNEWKSQQVFVISINNSDKEVDKYGVMTVDKVIARCCRLGVYPAFIYNMFDSTEEIPRFNVVFMLKEFTEDIRVRNSIQVALLKIFPESDISSKDLSTIYYGTNKEYRKFQDMNNCIETYKLIHAMIVRIKEINSNPANITKNIDNYCKSVGLNIINGFPNVKIIINNEKGKSMTNSIIINIENDIDFPKMILMNFNISKEEVMLYTKEWNNNKKLKQLDIKKNKTRNENGIRDFNFEELMNNCRLWNEFVLGERWCYHNEIFGISTNLWRVIGGEKRVTRVINDMDFYKDKVNKINTIKSSRAYEYLPQKCSNFCPYWSNCGSNTMLESLNTKRSCIKQYAGVPVYDIEYAEDYLRTSFEEAFNNNDNSINIIIAPTGIGKTAVLEDVKNFNRVCISYPNHKLGLDIAERLNIENVVHVKELSIKNDQVLKEYRRLISIGAYRNANDYIENYKKNLDSRIDQNEINHIDEYFNNKKELINTERPILCTHSSMVLNQSSNTDTYIIDEDILLSTLVPTTIINEQEIYNLLILAKEYKDDGTISKYLELFYNKITCAKENLNNIQSIENVYIDQNELNKFIEKNSENLRMNLKELLYIRKVIATTNQYKEIIITGISKRELPNKKCIILSATANPLLYRWLFPNRKIKVYDSGLVETKGKLVLHYQGYSRKYLKDNIDKVIDDLKGQATGIKNIITYKSFKETFEDNGFDVIAHFGACSGIDRYKGEDLIVLGTPHFNLSSYMLIASLIINNSAINNEMEYIKMVRSGYEFSFYTFKENGDNNIVNLLREIQFYLIESELIQAIGRARILRKEATVHLFSNCPIPGASIYKE